jgi:hypothetical protein
MNEPNFIQIDKLCAIREPDGSISIFTRDKGNCDILTVSTLAIRPFLKNLKK